MAIKAKCYSEAVEYCTYVVLGIWRSAIPHEKLHVILVLCKHGEVEGRCLVLLVADLVGGFLAD